jgi:acetyl esterase/lipase
MMSNRALAACALLFAGTICNADPSSSFDPAAAFGARPSVSRMRLSPDGMSVVYIAPARGQGSVAYTLSLAKGSVPKPAFAADGKPFRLDGCHWVSNDRLVCIIYWIVNDAIYGSTRLSRTVAVDSDGKNVRVLSMLQNDHSRGWNIDGGLVIDWLPEEDRAVLMQREYFPDDHLGSHVVNTAEGLGVDWIDTRKMIVKRVESARSDAVDYISDGRGTVRIMATRQMLNSGEKISPILGFSYRLTGSREWRKLSEYNTVDRTGFNPEAIDHDKNVVYGYKKKDGRLALYSLSLDGELREELIYANPEVDVSGLIQIGRRNRPVAAAYSTDVGRAAYFAPEIGSQAQSLGRALPDHLINVLDASLDESRMLILSSSDVDPGVYYIFDRNSHQLQTSLVIRSQLEGVKLANVKPITYSATDGTQIPAYLTLPPGREDAKGLPAIVLPHGGPSFRDEWGFDWLPQFFAARGYVVLQPNFRGSGGYGDQWFQKNGFKSWPIAMGDVLDAGRWLARQDVADPSKLAIVGWSYGGYSALQAAVVDSTVFKAVIAIAPVTDLAALKEASRNWTNFQLVSDYVGSGSVMHGGSPIEHVDKIKVPVLLFHGGHDANVGIEQSRSMAARLKSAGVKCELVTWDELDHQLDDSAARTEMLRKSDEFLRGALGR